MLHSVLLCRFFSLSLGDGAGVFALRKDEELAELGRRRRRGVGEERGKREKRWEEGVKRERTENGQGQISGKLKRLWACATDAATTFVLTLVRLALDHPRRVDDPPALGWRRKTVARWPDQEKVIWTVLSRRMAPLTKERLFWQALSFFFFWNRELDRLDWLAQDT